MSPACATAPALRRYLAGLLGVLVGAGWTDASGSMLPLAMGSALALMCTAGLVRSLRARAAARAGTRARR